MNTKRVGNLPGHPGRRRPNLAVSAGQTPAQVCGPDLGHPGHFRRISPVLYTRAMTGTPGMKIETPTHVCELCGRATGNLTKHTPACERMRNEVLRATSHVDESAVVENGVTDLDLARLLRALDKGAVIHPTATLSQWRAPMGSPLATSPRRPLNATVNEALRVHLARLHHEVTARDEDSGIRRVRSYLVAAPVHARDPRRTTLPRCVGAFTYPGWRWRLLDDLALVDCQACVDLTHG